MLAIIITIMPLFFHYSGETAGVATTERKNRDRMLNNEVPMKRKIIGKKGDGFVRSVGSIRGWASLGKTEMVQNCSKKPSATTEGHIRHTGKQSGFRRSQNQAA